jgi:hypothetical protein
MALKDGSAVLAKENQRRPRASETPSPVAGVIAEASQAILMLL